MINRPQYRIQPLFSIILLLGFFSIPILLNGQNKLEEIDQNQLTFAYKELSTPNPTIEAKALYRYLQNMLGEKILSGQMSASWGIDELKYINSITLKQPAILGFDFAVENNNQIEIQKAIKWWQAGGIPTIMWNWKELTLNSDYKNSSEIDLNRCFRDGTSENKAMWTELKKMADNLEKIKDANVPVIWSPFYKLNKNTFWWEKQGPDLFKKLWITMYTYFVQERKLNNLIWVFGQDENPGKDWFPGNEFTDIVGAGTLGKNSSSQSKMYKELISISDNNLTPLAYHYCGTMPDPDECLKSGVMWSWWMQWHTTHLQSIEMESLRKAYKHNLVITLQEVPNIVQKYSGNILTRDFNVGRTISFSELKSYKLGSKSESDKLAFNEKRLEITTAGNDIGGKKDDGYFTFKQIVGDFDISVQVLHLSAANLYTKAGIMARVDLSNKSEHVFFHVFPDNNTRNKNLGGCEFQYRTQKSKETKAIYPNDESAGNKYDVNFPNTWIRLKRNGNIFKSYISYDNKNWQIYARHKQNMPEKLLIGLAVTSSDSNKATKAEFSSLFVTWER